MGRALEVVTGQVTNATAFTDASVFAGNSFTVRSTRIEAQILMLELWADTEDAGDLRIRSPRLHDNVDGLRFALRSGFMFPFGPRGISQKLISQDQLSVQMLQNVGGAGIVSQASFLLYYEDLPGVEANLITSEELRPRVRNILTTRNGVTGASSTAYTAEEAIVADADLLKANVNYAILGYIVDADVTTVRYRGSDTGNLGVGGPGASTLNEVTADWFVKLSELYRLPTIPVFNASNKDALLVDIADNTGAQAVEVNTILAELG